MRASDNRKAEAREVSDRLSAISHADEKLTRIWSAPGFTAIEDSE